MVGRDCDRGSFEVGRDCDRGSFEDDDYLPVLWFASSADSECGSPWAGLLPALRAHLFGL